MAKICRVMSTTKYICFVIVCLFVLNIFWYVWTNILMPVKYIDIDTGKTKVYGKKLEIKFLGGPTTPTYSLNICITTFFKLDFWYQEVPKLESSTCLEQCFKVL